MSDLYKTSVWPGISSPDKMAFIISFVVVAVSDATLTTLHGAFSLTIKQRFKSQYIFIEFF